MDLAPPVRNRRLVSLTPMIDVVFLLLVFFMLASRFSTENTLALASGAQGGSSAWDGAPRLLVVAPASLTFNGRGVTLERLGVALDAAGVGADQPILLRAAAEADVQRLTDVLDALDGSGFNRPVLLP